MRVNEVFYSIQGEGIYAGVPMWFVRLQGCNLKPRCSWCDTTYAQDIAAGYETTTRQIVDEIVKDGGRRGDWVCITGGEPLQQHAELGDFVAKLSAIGLKTEIETNGSLFLPGWRYLVDSWCVDIKCPSSGVCGASRIDILPLVSRPEDQIKFVVADQADLRFVREVLQEVQSIKATKMISPVINNADNFQSDIEWCQQVVEFCKQERARFSLQLHKVLYGSKKGV